MTLEVREPAVANRIVLPSKFDPIVPELGLTPGLYLMHAKKTGGKTLNSLAMAYWLRDGLKTNCAFEPMMEPRAPNTFQLLVADKWSVWFRQSCEALSGGVLIIDSMNYVIGRLPEVEEVVRAMGQVTYPGGLTPRDVIGTNAHNQIAEALNVAVIGTINSELYPVVDVLEGACEGRVLITSTSGAIQIRSRLDRETRSHVVPPEFHATAVKKLGYDRRATKSVSSTLEVF